MIRLVRVRDPWGVAPPPACKSNDWAALATSEQDKERLRPTEQGEFWLVRSFMSPSDFQNVSNSLLHFI